MTPALAARLRTLASLALLALGSLQMLGAVTGAIPLLRVGRALVAAPLPLVFSRVGGLETFARRFSLDVESAGGTLRHFTDEEVARALRGPFSRRAIYLGALTFWSGLEEPERSAIVRFAVCDDGPVARDLALTAPARRLLLRSWSAAGPEEPELRFELDCAP